MRTKMSAQSSADIAPSQTSVVSTTTTQSSVWSLCDISTDSHVDLGDITPSISPVFTDDQVHELTRNPNAVDVLEEHFLAPETLKRIDEVLNSEEQTKLLYSIATTAAAGTAPYSHNEAALPGALKNNSDELLHAELNFPEAMFRHFDSMDNDNDRMMNKETDSLHPIPATASGSKVSQITQAGDGDWQKDGTTSADGQEQKLGEQGDSDVPKGLRRSPRKRVPVNKDSNRTLAPPPKPVSRGKDISKLKYVNDDKEKTKKEVAKKEVRRSGRMQKKAEKDDSSDEKDSEEPKANIKRKTSKPIETEDDGKELSEKQDTASKNVRRSPRNQSKTPQEEKLKMARGRKGKLPENGNDNRKQKKTVVSEKESSDEAAVLKKKTKVPKSEDEEKGENEKIGSEKEVKEQDEQEEKMKSARRTRNTGNKDKEKEGEMGNINVKRRRKKVENEGKEGTEKISQKVEEELVKSKRESDESKNDKSALEDDNSFSGVKENERQSEKEEKNSSEESEGGRTKRGKKDQAKGKETEIEKKGIEIEIENQGVAGRRGRKRKENLQQSVTKETESELMAKVSPLTNGDKTTEEKPVVVKADSQENKSVKEELTSDKKSGDLSSTKQTEKTTFDKNKQNEFTTDEKHRDEQEGSDVESSENEEEFNEDSDYDPEYDPDRLWCVCRKPHGNRFMICCDHCEEWFHGACVGITMSQGRQMEKRGQEYICPKCKVKLEEETNKKSDAVKPEQMPPSTPEKKKQDIVSKKDQSPKLKMPDNKEGTRRRRHFIQRTSGGNVIKDEKRSKEESGDKVPSSVHVKEERKRKVHESTGFKIPKKVRTTPTPASHVTHPAQRKCIASGCTVLTYHDSLYCSQDCIARHAEESVRILTEERRKRMGAKVPGGSSKSATSPTSSLLGTVPWEANHTPVSSYSEPSSKEGIAVIERSTGRVIAGVAAPSQEELVFWLQDHPMFEVLRPSGGKADKKKEKKEDSEKAVRENIKKSLKEILMARCKDQQDLSVSEEEFQKSAITVEEEMFSFFGDTGHRYKNKYRSLMFNLKDPRNKVLFRHVLSGEITVDRLVRMTPEQLASPELATWREQEAKHTLEMIKQSQEEINATKAHIKKTHKGEVEIDGDDDLSSLENSVKAKSDLNVEKDLPDSNNSSSTLLLDTTDEHRIHLFDLNCRICTGKIAPPGEPPRREAPAPLVSTTSIIQAVAESSIPSPTPMDVTSANSPDSASVSQPPLSPSQATKTQKKVPAVWKGFVMMQSVAKFGTNAYRVSGSCDDLLQLLPDTLHVQGRIAHEQVWDYLMQLKSSNSREVCVIRYEASSDEEKMSYVSLYSYFYSRSRCGVVSNCYTGVKDMYLVPLASHQPIPPELLPFNGPGLNEPRPHMLLGVIVRVKTLFKRPRALSQRSLSPPTKRRASSGGQETSTEGGAAESPANKRNEKVELHDSPPADIDDIVFQYHTSQAIRKVNKEPSGSPAKVSTPSDTSTPSLSSSSGAVVYPTEQPVAMSLEAQKQHLLDLQERARQYILAQIQRKETSSVADSSEEAGQLKEETSKATESEKHGTVADDDAPYDPEEGLELDLDPPSAKAEAAAPDLAPSAPAVVVTTQEPTKPSSIEMLVSTLKKLQGAAVKSHSPQQSALSSVLSFQASSSKASIPQDQSNTSTVSVTLPFQPTALAQTTVLAGQGQQSVSGGGILQSGGKSQSTASPNPAQPELTKLTHRLLSAISTGRGTGSPALSREAFQSTGPNSRGQHGTVLAGREPRPSASASASVDSVCSGSQSTVLGVRLSELTAATRQQAPASVDLGPQSTFVSHPSVLIGGGPLSTTPSGATGVLPPSIGHGAQSSVSIGRDTHLAVAPGSYQRSTAATNQRQQSVAQTGDPSNRWQPSEPPQVVRQVDTVTQRVGEYDNLRPEDRARLAAHESRLESREGRRFPGHDRDERSEQGRVGERQRHDWDERRYPRDFRPHESGNSWRGQYAPGRRWSDEERRRDRYERPMDNRSRPGDRRDERRFKEHWNRDRWRR